ncbi:MAG: HAMP domain-containing protein [Rhodocyclaceae bacterium]|nr:HAMP domain-containing protein [Rhodocyclaceae bacterium]
MNILTQDCSELRPVGFGRVWLCRLLKPTLGKKLLLVFAVLALTGAANFLAFESVLANARGLTALVNVSGGLRWLSQGIQLDTLRILRGDKQDRAAIDAKLARLEETIRSLENGGSAQGLSIRGLPDELAARIVALRLAGIEFGQQVRLTLAGQAQEAETAARLERLHAGGAVILNAADAIAARLTDESQRLEREAIDKLLRLGLLDMTILLGLWLAVRLRVIHPLRKLASASRRFARGQHAARSGFRSFDEIGQLSAAFDAMADEVERDLKARRQAEASLAGMNAELERRVAERTRQLAQSNRELEAFSYSVSHDLRAPLRGINGFAGLLEEHCQGCPQDEPREYRERIRRASLRMGKLIDDLLDLSRLTRSRINPERVDLSAMARAILEERAVAEPGRAVEIEVQEGLQAEADATLLQAVLENLLGNAWKFSAGRTPARIVFGCRQINGEPAFFVADNGAGFDMQYASKLFGAFQRLHKPEEFEGNGIGLAMVNRIVGLHGGRVWAESSPDAGSRFYFTLARQEQAAEAGYA